MKAKTAILALVLMSAITSSAEWKVEKHIDEMTDVVQYIVWTSGTVVQIDSLLDYTPQLQLRLTSPKYKSDTDDIAAKFDLLLVIDTDGLNRRGAEVLYRIDNDEAVHEIWTPSTERHGAFSPHPRMLYKKLKDAKTLRIRYVTTLGNIRTTRFDVSGIQRAMQKIKEEVRLIAPDNNSPSGRATAEESESETPPPDPKLVAKAKATMNDVIEALTYAKTCAGPMPRMKSEITLTKPLAALKNAITKKERAADYFKTIETRFNNMKPGNLSRPSQAHFDRAQSTLKKAEKELAESVAEVRRLSSTILRTTAWPTPELFSEAQVTAARIPLR